MNALILAILLQALDLSTIASTGHSFQRIDHPDGDVHVNVSIALTEAFQGVSTYRTDFCLTVASGEATIVKSGTAGERSALRKKYARLAVSEYLAKKNAGEPQANTDQGSTAVSKANISEPGDTQ